MSENKMKSNLNVILVDDPLEDNTNADKVFFDWATFYFPDAPFNPHHVRVVGKVLEEGLKKEGNEYLKLIINPGRPHP